jgi:hypothetical protein
MIFKTEKAVLAYKEIKNTKQRIKDIIINERIFDEEEISKNPLTIRIIVKIPWLAEKVGIKEKISTTLISKGLYEPEDYEMRIE